MKSWVVSFFSLLAMAILLANCHGDLFTKKTAGYPFFNVSTDQVDFGLVDVEEEPYTDIYVRNMGSKDSKMNVFFYLAGDPAFRLLTTDEEYVVREGEPLLIRVAFAPCRTSLQTGELIIYYSDRPLRENINVGTFQVALSGVGRQGCVYPGDKSVLNLVPAQQSAQVPYQLIQNEP